MTNRVSDTLFMVDTQRHEANPTQGGFIQKSTLKPFNPSSYSKEHDGELVKMDSYFILKTPISNNHFFSFFIPSRLVNSPSYICVSGVLGLSYLQVSMSNIVLEKKISDSCTGEAANNQVSHRSDKVYLWCALKSSFST